MALEFAQQINEYMTGPSEDSLAESDEAKEMLWDVFTLRNSDDSKRRTTHSLSKADQNQVRLMPNMMSSKKCRAFRSQQQRPT